MVSQTSKVFVTPNVFMCFNKNSMRSRRPLNLELARVNPLKANASHPYPCIVQLNFIGHSLNYSLDVALASHGITFHCHWLDGNFKFHQVVLMLTFRHCSNYIIHFDLMIFCLCNAQKCSLRRAHLAGSLGKQVSRKCSFLLPSFPFNWELGYQLPIYWGWISIDHIWVEMTRVAYPIEYIPNPKSHLCLHVSQ